MNRKNELNNIYHNITNIDPWVKSFMLRRGMVDQKIKIH